MTKIVCQFVFLFFISSTCLFAQSADEVLEKFPGELAVILNYNRDVRIFFKDNQPVAETKEEVQILVLDDKANGIYNKYKIYHSSFEEIKDIEAYTKMPDGNKYKKIKVTDMKTETSTSSGIFFDDSKETTFDFPSMMKGSVSTVAHTQFLKDAHLLIPFYFTSYMPVVNAKFTVSFPSDLDLHYIIKNNETENVKMTEDKKSRQTVYTFTSTDTKYKDRYGDGPSRAHYEPHVIIYIASYKNVNGDKVNYLADVKDLYNWNYTFLKNINTEPSSVIKHLADSLTNGVSSEREKAKAIYSWVQQHIKYVAFENGLEGFIPRQAGDVCTKRYGDCKDMASLLTALLKEAGLKAYFTWIGTRSIPYSYTEVPLPITDNHMISTVRIGDEWIFLDGTDPNCIFGLPSQFIQEKQALVSIDEKEFKLLTVPVVKVEKNYITDSTLIQINDNGIKGTSSVYYNGYFGIDAYNSLLYRDEKDTKEYVKAQLSKGSNKFILGDYTVNRVNPEQKIINLKTNFEIPDYSKKIADELYINLNLNKSSFSSLIDTVKRKIGVDNDFMFQLKNYTILDVPKDFEVSYMPEGHHYKNDLFSFNIKYSLKDNKVIAEQEFKSECMLLQPKDFSKWNETVKEIANQYKQQIVLKKK